MSIAPSRSARALGRFLLLAIVACAPLNRVQAQSDSSLILSARRDQNAAIRQRDFERVASHWTDDVAIRRGLGASIAGKQAYRASFEGDHEMLYQREPAEVTVSAKWPLAFETGTWTGSPVASPGTPVIRGRYSAQWVKRDGTWLIRGEVFVALECAGEGCTAAAVP